MNGTMRRWEMDELGRARLALRSVPVPKPASGEVLVKVAAASLNYRDKLVIESGMGLTLTFPSRRGPISPERWRRSARA